MQTAYHTNDLYNKDGLGEMFVSEKHLEPLNESISGFVEKDDLGQQAQQTSRAWFHTHITRPSSSKPKILLQWTSMNHVWIISPLERACCTVIAF